MKVDEQLAQNLQKPQIRRDYSIAQEVDAVRWLEGAALIGLITEDATASEQQAVVQLAGLARLAKQHFAGLPGVGRLDALSALHREASSRQLLESATWTKRCQLQMVVARVAQVGDEQHSRSCLTRRLMVPANPFEIEQRSPPQLS